MLKKALERFYQNKQSLRLRQRPLLFLVILGSLTWSITMVKSGLVYSFGMGFWGPNGHDGVWHIALIESLARGSWDMPTFAGMPLRNYHVGFDLLVVVLHKLSFVPVRILYFQIIPPILAILTGIFIYKFVHEWTRSKLAAFWATFFVYFGGSFGWIVTLIREGRIGGESMFWAQQSISTLLNPPFALSILLMFAGLILLVRLLRRKNTKLLIPVVIIFGILIQIKIYAGILALGGLFVAGIYQVVKRRGTTLVKVFLGAVIISLFLFFPLNKDAGSAIVFRPFWFLETMMGLSDRFYWPKFYEAMVNYRLGNIWFKTIPAYLVAFLIFWYGNMGTRFISEFFILRRIKDKKTSFIEVFLLSVILAGVVLPMFFLQVGTPWNTIQFFYYSLAFSGILAGVFLGQWLDGQKNDGRAFLAVSAVIVLTLPTTVATLRHYLPARPPAKISKEELEALKFLSERPTGVVLTYPFDRSAAEAAVANPPRPLYLYESTAYVAAFSQKPVFLEDEVNLDITGYDWRTRRKAVEEFYENLDHRKVRAFLEDNNIKYIYWIRGQRAKLGESQLGIEKIFENSELNIYKVDLPNRL